MLLILAVCSMIAGPALSMEFVEFLPESVRDIPHQEVKAQMLEWDVLSPVQLPTPKLQRHFDRFIKDHQPQECVIEVSQPVYWSEFNLSRDAKKLERQYLTPPGFRGIDFVTTFADVQLIQRGYRSLDQKARYEREQAVVEAHKNSPEYQELLESTLAAYPLNPFAWVEFILNASEQFQEKGIKIQQISWTADLAESTDFTYFIQMMNKNFPRGDMTVFILPLSNKKLFKAHYSELLKTYVVDSSDYEPYRSNLFFVGTAPLNYERPHQFEIRVAIIKCKTDPGLPPVPEKRQPRFIPPRRNWLKMLGQSLKETFRINPNPTRNCPRR